MATPEIKLVIRPDGTISAKTEGMYGPECEDWLPVLEQLLAARITKVEHTDDYHRTQPIEHQQDVGGS